MTSQRNTSNLRRHRRTIARTKPNCHHCGQPIRYDLKYPHPDSFVVDHLVPIANGGTDTLDNKVASCARCNRAKSDKPHAPTIRKSTSLNW